ncbi:hypothetical protein BG011_001466 [Mortierella polycephala]|uniref:IPT/TIG domain-containing protein n=1 Tax=Mortierella polycephala TaxID=41804 RepID=A0A9P6U5T9_9FUNG|nr:hypothetical protein BG011_001466 [Mortierella polycephala]
MAELAYAPTTTSLSSDQVRHLLPQGFATITPRTQAIIPTAAGLVMSNGNVRQPLIQHGSAPSMRSNDVLVPPLSSALLSTYGSSYEAKYTDRTELEAQTTTATVPPETFQRLAANNFYAHSTHTPFYAAGLSLAEEASLGHSSQGSSAVTLLGPGSIGSLEDTGLPAFDVRAYTFRKKSRHYVAVKHKNALRIEPIIYLKTSILSQHREVLRNWDYLRISIARFRENAIPKKKLSAEELRTARILDVDMSLVSPSNDSNRPIEYSCPACVMRMIMQVLAKNFKLTPNGDPVIDIRKGHAIICIKLNCYCDHHNEQDGFVVRMRTIPDTVRMGSSVTLRICCEARSKLGPPADLELEDEDGLTDIDAPLSIGSRSPLGNERSLQSPSLSYGSESPDPRARTQQQSTNSSSIASPRSVDEKTVYSLDVENSLGERPPVFRRIYPLTPSEGTCLGGTRVTIHGAHFDVLQHPVVFFGKAQAEMVTISHHDVMECTTPPAEGLKPGIVQVRIASQAYPLNVETDRVEFMYMAPPDYDFFNMAATSLSYAMANEYPPNDSLAFILNGHGSIGRSGLGQGLMGDLLTDTGFILDQGIVYAATEDVVLDFLKVIQILAPGRLLPSFKSESGHTLLHMAVQCGMVRLVRELLAMGIDHTAMDRNRKTALLFAQMTSNVELTRMLSQAKVPPRPTVPAFSVDTTISASNIKETIAVLIQKHEGVLIKALAKKQENKKKELSELRDRSMHIIGLRDGTIAMDSDPDEILEHLSGDSSHSSASSDESEQHLPVLESKGNERKRRSRTEITEGTIKKLAMESGAVKVGKERLDILDQSQLAFIRKGSMLWERTRAKQLFGDISGLVQSTEMQVWVCDSVETPTFKDSTASTSSLTGSIALSETKISALALSAAGLHLYTEQQPSGGGATARHLENWSLIEIDRQALITKNTGETALIKMCGLIPRGGRSPSGEQLVIHSVSAPEIVRAITDAKARLMGHQRLAAKDNWIMHRIKTWSTLFGVDEREMDVVLSNLPECKDNTLTIKPAPHGHKGHSLAMTGAFLCLIRDVDTCLQIQYMGVVTVDDGWSRPELVGILKETVGSRKDVCAWEFTSCGWTTTTVQGFVQGLGSSNGDDNHCRSITLTENKFKGDDSVGHLLANCFQRLKGLESIDLRDCDIGLDGMEALVHCLKGVVELRIQGNRADDRWWQWMETVLIQNPQMQRCSLVAPIAPTDAQSSLLSIERLRSLKDLVELDLSHHPITTKTLQVLETCLRDQKQQHLTTLILSHCQLSWSDLSSLFAAICEINASTKSTLNVSKNPLFNAEESILDWISSVKRARVKVPFGLQITDLVMDDETLQRILNPLEHATCFNELNMKGLFVKRPHQTANLDYLSYDEERSTINPDNASVQSCLALHRILASNLALVMLDVSGSTIQRVVEHGSSASEPTTVAAQRSVGGFGPQISHAFPALAKNSTLRILTIDNNRFGEEGMGKLSEALKSNTSIGVLNCDGNDAFTPKGLRAIERIFIPPPSTTAMATVNSATGHEAERNYTLSVWTPDGDEILMHMQLLHDNIQRLSTEYSRVQDRINQSDGETKFLGLTPVADAEKQRENAKRERIEYSDRHDRIVNAISENNQRTKRAYEQQQQE